MVQRLQSTKIHTQKKCITKGATKKCILYTQKYLQLKNKMQTKK